MKHWNIKKQIIDHAKEEYPKESCGFILTYPKSNRYGYFPVKNISSTPKESFIIDSRAWINTPKDSLIFSIVHSHPNSDISPSEADYAKQLSSHLPWVIASPQGYMRPLGTIPLYGRPWIWRVWDCLNLVEEVYKFYDWGTIFWDQLEPESIRTTDKDIFHDAAKTYNWKEVNPSKAIPGDVLVVNQHVGVILPDYNLAHHPIGRLSIKVKYNYKGVSNAAKIYRKAKEN